MIHLLDEESDSQSYSCGNHLDEDGDIWQKADGVNHDESTESLDQSEFERLTRNTTNNCNNSTNNSRNTITIPPSPVSTNNHRANNNSNFSNNNYAGSRETIIFPSSPNMIPFLQLKPPREAKKKASELPIVLGIDEGAGNNCNGGHSRHNSVPNSKRKIDLPAPKIANKKSKREEEDVIVIDDDGVKAKEERKELKAVFWKRPGQSESLPSEDEDTTDPYTRFNTWKLHAKSARKNDDLVTDVVVPEERKRKLSGNRNSNAISRRPASSRARDNHSASDDASKYNWKRPEGSTSSNRLTRSGKVSLDSPSPNSHVLATEERTERRSRRERESSRERKRSLMDFVEEDEDEDSDYDSPIEAGLLQQLGRAHRDRPFAQPYQARPMSSFAASFYSTPAPDSFDPAPRLFPMPRPSHAPRQNAHRNLNQLNTKLGGLLTREITPEDYDLLCTLDEPSPKQKKEKKKAAPKIKTTKLKAIPPDTPNCPICLEDFVLEENVKWLQCSHVFHSDCIQKWMEMSETCPVCKEPMK